MQEYYAMKLKNVMIQLCSGFGLIIFGGCIIASIVQEMLGSYRSSSRYAYIAGLVISAVMILAGVLIVYSARHYDRIAFGDGGYDLEVFSSDLNSGKAVFGNNIIFSEDFLVVFYPFSLKVCTVIRTSDIIGCYENRRWTGGDDMSDYSLKITDRKFRTFILDLNEQNSYAGHELKERLRQCMPWIFMDNEAKFQDLRSTRKGRRRITLLLKSRQEDAQSGSLVSDDTEEISK